jgi:GntR family transcriptional regulator
MRYLQVADALRSRIAAGDYGSGGALPSEADLGRSHGVSRVTVRRALEELRSEGIVTSRKGSGWFVAVDPVRQALGRFSTLEAAVEAAGLPAGRRVLDFRFEAAPPDVVEVLELETGADVLAVTRVSEAGGEPFALVTVWVPPAHGSRLSRDDVVAHTFYELLTREGVDLGGATQTITGGAAGDDDARHLGVRPGSPLLVCRRVTRDAAGRPVLASEHRYPAHRTAFEVELPRVHTGEPVGLHLVDVPPATDEPGRPGAPYPSQRRTRGESHG